MDKPRVAPKGHDPTCVWERIKLGEDKGGPWVPPIQSLPYAQTVLVLVGPTLVDGFVIPNFGV